MRLSHLAVLSVVVMLSGATAFAIAQPNQSVGTAKAGGSKKVVKQLKQVNANLQVVNSSVQNVNSGVDTLNDRIGSSTSGDSVRGLLEDLNASIGRSGPAGPSGDSVRAFLQAINRKLGDTSTFNSVIDLLDDVERNTCDTVDALGGFCF